MSANVTANSARPLGYVQGLNGTQSRINLVDINSRSTIFRKREFYKNISIALACLIVLLVLGLFIMTSFYIKAYDALSYATRICLTEECLRSASNLQLSIDKSIDPCDDFYRFSCGFWSAEHPNHGWYPKFSTFETIDERISIATLNFLKSSVKEDEPKPVKQTRDMYKSCMDQDATDRLGYSVIYKYLKEVGLPSVPSYFTKKEDDDDFKFDWVKVSAKLRRIFAMNLLIQFDIDANIFNRSQNVLYIGSGINPSPLPSPFTKKHYLTRSIFKHYKMDDESVEESKAEAASKRAITEIFKAVIGNVSDVPDKDKLEKAVNLVWNITLDVITLVGDDNTTLDEIDLRKFKVDEMQKISDKCLKDESQETIQVWKPFLEQLFDGIDPKFDYDKDYLYALQSELSYMCNILLYIKKHPDMVWELYHWWSVVKNMIISTTSEIVEVIYKETSDFYDDGASDVTRSQALECAQLTNNFMGMAISYGIADKTFMNNTKPKVEQMLSDIKDAFVERVNNIAWMDKETKKATLEKSAEMISFIGFPEWLLNKTAIEIYYGNITVKPGDYLENMMQFIKESVTFVLTTYKDENEKTWRTDPTTVNAYNYFGDNSINVPMAILTFPVYHLGLEVLNYGAIGTILGHELTHGFDNTGRKYDKDGNFIQWWTNETIETFDEKTECFIAQYNNFSVPSINMTVDGRMTLGENLADNGGLHHAFLAYKNYVTKYGNEARLPGFEAFTNEQLFFIAYGSIWCESRTLGLLVDQLQNDEHCPSYFRVLGTLQNSHEFAAAFNCPLGSKMNPNRTRCRIW